MWQFEVDRLKMATGRSAWKTPAEAIVLSGPAVGAWQEAGETWKAWSASIISTKNQLRKNKDKADTLHILSCYAPTRAASRTKKNRFYGYLQQVLAAIPSDEIWVTSTPA